MEIKIDNIVKQVIQEVQKENCKTYAQRIEKVSVPEKGKVAILSEAENYQISEIILPEVGDREVLVKMEGCIVSEDDAGEFLKGAGYQIPVVGEEGTGKVVKVGGNVKDVYGRVIQEGDKVSVLGSVNLKKAGYGDKSREFKSVGWYSSYVVLKENMKILQMNEFDLDSRMLYRKVSQAASSVDRILKLYKPEKYSRIAVAGCGETGLLVIAALKCAGFSDIIAIDEDNDRLDLAEIFGAKYKVMFQCRSGMHGLVEKVKECLGGELADLAVQCTELPGGNSIPRRFVKSGGNVADLSKHMKSCLTREAYSQGEKMLRLAQTLEIPLYRLITHRFHLEELNQANWTVLSGKTHVCAVLNR